MDTISATQVLSGLSVICAGVVITLLRGLNAKSTKHDEAFARIEALLTGANGDNGVIGDVKQLRQRSHDLGASVQNILFRVGALEDRRTGPDDRRASA